MYLKVALHYLLALLLRFQTLPPVLIVGMVGIAFGYALLLDHMKGKFFKYARI